jgi:eukaryotic-like serine/threonine-protein kinase
VGIPAERKPNVRFDKFQVDLRTGEVRTEDRKFYLQEQPFQVLQQLLECPGELVARDDLKKRLWPSDTFVDFDHSLNKAVNRLREALEDSAEHPRIIETLPRRGYRFIASLADGNGSGGSTASVGIADSDSRLANGFDSADYPVPPPVPRSRNLFLYTTLAAVLVITAFAIVVRKWPRVSGRANSQPMKITKLTDSGRVENVALSPDGRYVAYVQRGPDGWALRLRQVGTESDIQILSPEDLPFTGLTFSPNESDIYFVRAAAANHGLHALSVIPMLGGRPRQILERVDSAASFSPDGLQFVYTRGVPGKSVSEVRIAGADGNGDRLLAVLSDTFTDFQPGAAWSPDGRTIAAAFVKKDLAGWTLVAVQADTGSAHELYSSPRSIGTPRWLPDGSGILLTLDDSLQLGQLWIIPFPRGTPRRVTNDISNYDPFIDTARHVLIAAALSQSVVHNLWEAAPADPAQARQLTSGAMPYAEIVTTSDGRLAARGWDGHIWIMNPDGSGRALIPGVNNAATLASCGRFLVANSYRAGVDELLRFDVDAANLKVVAATQSYGPFCSPDGKSVFYLDLSRPQTIQRISIDGGPPQPVAQISGDGLVTRISLSPDGSLLAYLQDASNPEPARILEILRVDSGTPVKSFGLPPSAVRLSWSRTSNSIRFLNRENGISNLWEQSLAGGPPKQLTHFTSDPIVDYAFSLDGHRLTLLRGYISSDVVLLSNFR